MKKKTDRKESVKRGIIGEMMSLNRNEGRAGI